MSEKITTHEFARRLGVQANTVRRALCVQGHYLGLRPVKLPNGRLLWSATEVEALINGEQAGKEPAV